MSDEAEQPPAIGPTVEEQAAFWRINRKTALRWRNLGAPLGEYDGMMAWAAKRDRSKLPEGFLAKLRDDGEGAAIPGQDDPDWAGFEAQLRDEDPKEAMARLEKACAWASFKLEKAGKTNDRKSEKHYADLVAKLESVKHDALLRAKKLGIDSGELIKRELVAAYAESLGFWLLRGADEAINEITPKLVAASARGQLSRDTIIEILEAALLGSRVVNPLTRSTTTTANNAVPDWLADAIKRGLARVIEPAAPTLNAL